MTQKRRLIDADEFREDWLLYGAYEHIYSTSDILKSIDEAPTVDAEKIVRCRDCRYFRITDYAKGTAGMGCCVQTGCGVKQDDFCSYGKCKSGTKPQRECT